MATIQLDHVSYELQGRRIVDDASWKIAPGEHWGILGPNGAGKTTLLRIAGGYLWPNAGGVVLRDGEQAVDLREFRRSVGWVSAEIAETIPLHEPVLDTVVSGRFAQVGLMRMAWDPATAEDYEQAREQLAQLRCSRLADRSFGALSQGERQLVMIARARMARPLLVVLDEPCDGLDPGRREEFLDSLQAMAKQPTAPSMVLVTQRLEEIVPAFQFLLAMSEGQVVGAGSRQEVVTPALLLKLYGRAPKEILHRNGRIWPIW